MPAPEALPPDLLKAVQQMGHGQWYFRDDLFRDDDIWLASYPRSGNHFVRFILISARHFLRHGRFPDDLSGMKAIPDVHGRRLDFAEGPPRILKTHFPFDPRYRRVIHLIRDPRDVIVSYFHYSKGLPHLFFEPAPHLCTLPEFVDMFVRGKVWPGDIKAHTASYASRAGDIEYTCIRYERLLEDPRNEYRRLLDAAAIDFPAAAIDSLIGHTGFANMRRLHRPESARAGLVESNPDYILRRGVAGQYKQVFHDQTNGYIASELTDYLEAHGYQ